MLQALNYQEDCRSEVTAAEILTVAVVSARYFQNHHERALCVMIRVGDIPAFSISRFNRRLHALSDWLYGMVDLLGELFSQTSETFILDSMPVPVCKRVRASRNKKACGKAYCGYCAAKGEKFFGWRLHLVCTTEGIPIAFDLLPAAEQDLTPLHELLFVLPHNAIVFEDKGYISTLDAASLLNHTGMRLVTQRRKNMTPNSWADDYNLRLYRKRIETVYSQMGTMGIQRLHVRTSLGLELKTQASLLALAFANLLN
jgi:hypothetical protein